MLAKLTDDAFDSEDWFFEIKWDGYRAIAETGKELRFYSRNGISFIDQYPHITTALKRIRRRLIIDGEIVALDDKGRAGFQLLQNYDPSESALAYYVFDILKTGNRDLTELPLVDRKDILKKSLTFNEVIRYSDHITGDGIQFYRLIKKQNIEGIIAKKADSHYESGLRTGKWLKIKNTAGQEAVIAGFTEPRKSRKFFGSLILGIYRGDKLIYAGHTGTGFKDKSLEELHEQLEPLITNECPFEVTPKTNMPPTWVQPKLVCNVKFSEITKDGIMRHPVFVGLRIDKEPKEVVKEKPSVVKAKSRTRAKAPLKNKRRSKTKAKRERSSAVADKAWDDDDTEITLDGKKVTLTNQQKVYFPDDKITKGDIVKYYQEIADVILPYLKDRPQSLLRTPNGILDKGFFHKDVGDTAPAWVKSKNIYSDSAKKEINYIVCNNRATLAYINNLGCIEINPWHSRLASLDKPDYIAIDIDPSSSNTFDQVIETALAVKEVFDRAGALCFCKTSGATGLHVYAPVGPHYNYDQIKDFAQLLAMMTHELVPEFTSLVRPLKARGQKIYIDFLQNRRGQTLASVYSARPKPGAPVSTPLDWKEVKKGLHPSQFTIKNIGSRLKKKGDLFKGVLGKGLDIKKCLKRLEKA